MSLNDAMRMNQLITGILNFLVGKFAAIANRRRFGPIPGNWGEIVGLTDGLDHLSGGGMVIIDYVINAIKMLIVRKGHGPDNIIEVNPIARTIAVSWTSLTGPMAVDAIDLPAGAINSSQTQDTDSQVVVSGVS